MDALFLHLQLLEQLKSNFCFLPRREIAEDYPDHILRLFFHEDSSVTASNSVLVHCLCFLFLLHDPFHSLPVDHSLDSYQDGVAVERVLEFYFNGIFTRVCVGKDCIEMSEKSVDIGLNGDGVEGDIGFLFATRNQSHFICHDGKFDFVKMQNLI